MTDQPAAELMDDPPAVIYTVVGLLLAAAAVAALVVLPDQRPGLLVGMAGLVLIASLSGWLFTRKGYSFVEGWFAGAVFFPLAIAFGIWGPRRAAAGR